VLTFTISATDVDESDTLAFSTGALPSGATFNPGTRTFSWTPDFTQSGTVTVPFPVADNGTPQLTHGAQQQAKLQERPLRRTRGTSHARTPAERGRSAPLNASRKRRIAAGAGVQVQEVNRLLAQFEQMQKVMKMMRGGNLGKMLRNMKGMMPRMR